MLTLMMLFFALALSGVAAFYSIVGLMAIFAAAPIPIAIMGSILEGSKLVVASWLYRNWKEIPLAMKSYFTVALTILMFLTSMGIFGFLSKAHLDQGVPTGDVAAKVALLDEKIKTEKENINAARQTLTQLDQQVNQTISRTTDASGTDRSIAIRRGQAKERLAISNDIGAAQSRIAKLNEERAPIASELRKVEAEVGPIKYIAALIYGDEATQEASVLEKAVRWVTILIVAVFDPLAVIMLIAANWSMVHLRKVEEEPTIEQELEIESEPEPVKQFSWRDLPYLSQPFKHFQNLKPIVAPSTEEQPIVEQPEGETELTGSFAVSDEIEFNVSQPNSIPEAEEHPVFKPDGHHWRSRPGG